MPVPVAHDPPLVGVSACLLGERVRYDGTDRRAPSVTELLARHVRLLPSCPEVLAGMGVPREPVELRGDVAAPRVVGVVSGRDWTRALADAVDARAAELLALGVAGHVLKSRSPSCGTGGIPVRDVAALRDGLFAAALRRRAPTLPLCEETDLVTDDDVRAFVARVRAYCVDA